MILDRVAAANAVWGFEVERTEIDCIVCCRIAAVKRHADKALLRDILAADIDLDSAIGEPLARGFAQPNASSAPSTRRLALRLKSIRLFARQGRQGRA